MSKFAIYRSNGTVLKESKTEHNGDGQQVYASDLEYNGTWMGECFLSVKVTSAYPIDFRVGDYIMYRGEKFVLGNDPSTVKKARRGTYGEGFTYDNIKFSALQLELTDIRFLDLVIGDNELHYTSLPDFPFFAASIDDYCDRLQANTNRWCAANGISEADYWLFITPSLTRTTQRCNDVDGLAAVAEERYNEAYGGGSSSSSSSSDDGSAFALDDEKKDVYVTVSNQSVWDALSAIKNDFGLNFVIRGRNVIIGSAGIPTNHIFEYGKGNGLSEIERTADDDQQIITRLYAYGSEKNLPIRYYANMNTKGYLLITGDYHAGSTADSISVSLENVPFGRGMFVDMESDDNSTVVWYAVKCMVGNVEFLANIEATNTDGGTARLLAFSATAGTGVTFTVNRTTQENIDAVKSAIDGGADRVTFLGGVNIDKFPGDRKYALTENMPNNMAVNKLMLPGFPNQSLYDWVIADGGTAVDSAIGKATWHGYTAIFSKEKLRPYIQSVNASLIGIREGVKVFDGSDDTNEIYPTIENTNADTIYDAETVHDNGIFGDGDNEPTVTLILPSFGSGFDLKEQCALGDSPTIAMKSGFCGGREFAIDTDSNGNHRVKKVQTDKWEVVCKREFDSLLQLYFPYSYDASTGSSSSSSDDGSEPYQVVSGDKYVLTGIPMTDTYIAAASKTLLEAALLFLSKNDYTRYTYLPKIDELFMAREHDDAGSSSLYMTIKEGDLLRFQDVADFLISNSMIFIDTLRIKENGNNGIPTYDVTLRNDKEVGSIQRMQEQINSITGSGVNVTGGGGGSGVGYNLNQLDSIIEGTGKKLFLSRVKDDVAQGIIGFAKGLWVKTKGLFGIDGNGNATLNSVASDNLHSGTYNDDNIGGMGYHVYKDSDDRGHVCTDYLDVRMKARFTELEIRRLSYINADQVQSMAASKVEKVVPVGADGSVLEGVYGEDYDDEDIAAYRCLAVADDGSTATKNGWALGDQARCQTFNVTAPGTYTNLENRLYWRLVVRVGQCYADGSLLDSSSSSSSSSSSDDEEPKVYHFFDLANIPDVAGSANDDVIIQDNGDEFDEFFADTNVVALIKANNDSYSFHGYMTAVVNNTPTNLNDAPAADDAVVQMGSQTDTDRMGFFITKADNLNTGPYIYAGVNDFTLDGKMITKITPAEVLISARKLKVFVNPNAGDAEPLVHYRGDWTQGSISYYYDEWDYDGIRWLCIFAGDSSRAEGITCAPGTVPEDDTAHDWTYYWKQISTKGYKLLPSTDVIKTAKTGTNTYDPATASLTCGYVKSVGNNITSVADATAKIDDTYNVYFRMKTRGGSWSTYYLYSNSGSYGTHARSLLSEFSLAQYEAVEFYLSTDNYSYSQMIIGIGGVYVRTSLTSYIDHVNVPVVADGENGTSPIVADLDNQMTSVACDKSGNVEGSSDKSLATTVRMYKGSTKQTSAFTSIDCKIGNSSIVGNSFVNGYKTSVNTTTGVVTITIEHGTNIDGKTDVDITAVMTIDGTPVTRTVTFTISGVRAGADGSPATIYELLPSKDAISFGSGTTSQSMYMELLKIVGDSAETLAMNYIQNSGLYVLYGTTNVPDEDDAKKLIDNIGNKHSDVQKWGVDNDSQDSTLTFGGENNNTATILSTATFTQIYLALYRKVTADGTTSYILLDRETVPIVKDGAKGQDGHDGQDGTDGNNGVDGADAVLVKLDPENIIITQSTEEVSGSYPLLTVGTITYNGSSTNVLGSATVKVVEGGVEKSNFSINSVSSDTCTALKADDGKTIGITNVETSGGEYLTSGYVTVSVTYDNKSYSVRLNFYCNLLGTWKTSIENGIESDISRHIGYYIDPNGNVVTTQQLGEFIRGWSENTAKLTETVGSRYNGNNLFGFSKGVVFGTFIPFVQGYGIVSNVDPNDQYNQAWIKNLGFEEKTGYYVVTCEAKMLGTANKDVTFSLYASTGVLNVQKTISKDSWTKLTMVYRIDTFADAEASRTGQLYINNIPNNNRIAIRYLQIERGSVPSAFGICAEDAANASEAMPLSITAKSEMPLNSGSNPGNLEGQPFYGQDISWNDDDANWVSYTSGGQNHYYIDLLRNSTSVNLESGKIYTLSFWARASINGMSIRSFLYPNIITAQGNATYIDGDSSKGIYDDGMTELYLTTSWRKYYVHWYVASGGNKNLIIARLCDQIISGTNSDNLYGYIYLCGIRFDKGYVTSANRTVYQTVMKQTARNIDFSVLVNSMEKAGIHLYTTNNTTPDNEEELAKGVIDLVADKVNFKDSSGANANTYIQITSDGKLKAVDGEFSGKVTATSGSFTGSLTLPADSGVFSYGGTDTTYGLFGLYMNSSLSITGQRTDYRNGGNTRGAVLRIEAARTNSSYRGIYCKGDAEVQGVTQLLKASTSDSYNALIAEGITDKGELTVDGNFNANGQMILGVSVLNTASYVTLPKCAKGRVMICPGAITVGKDNGVTLRDSTGSTVNSLSPNGRPRIFVAYDTDKWQEFYTG